jgi:FkbH-like protein
MPQTQLINDFNTLKKNLKRSVAGYKKLKLALLGDSATQLLALALKATAVGRELDLELFEADFDQIERQIFDAGSELYNFKPDFILIFKSAHKLLNAYNKLTVQSREHLAKDELERIMEMTARIGQQTQAPALFYNYTEINDTVFGNYSAKMPSSFLFQLRKLNYELMNYAAQQQNFHLIDLSSIQNQYGKRALFNPSFYVNTEMVLSLVLLPQVASLTLDLLDALRGRFKKCVIADLDHTLWGGVIGDDGLENIHLGGLGIGKAFTELQYWLKKLKERGIILAICSKNTEAVAKTPFEQHPDMVLRLDDIALFVANWESKVDNIRYIREVLNIGFDSIVFLDDNPYERNIVRESFPELTVPELPEDPAKYLEYLYALNLFETVSSSAEDAERTQLYQQEASRSAVQRMFTSEDEFLENLAMTATVEGITKFNLPRVAQLTQRSNQFNLRTVRYTEAGLQKLSNEEGVYPLTFTLDDKFGNNGLVCVVILKKESPQTLFIDSWLMSCRVLNRGMEHFVLNMIARTALANGYQALKGEYIPTGKNQMVEMHYPGLGFRPSGDCWLLELTGFKPKNTFIKIK